MLTVTTEIPDKPPDASTRGTDGFGEAVHVSITFDPGSAEQSTGFLANLERCDGDTADGR